VRSGILAEFETPDAFEKAFEVLRRRGYTRLDAWTPYPVGGVVRGGPESPVPWAMLGAGLLGGGIGYFVQWWVNVSAFPIDVGGRPLHSAPAFIPITFESAILAASVTGFVVMVARCGLPRLHHPLFEVEGFERASMDRFWLGVDGADPVFDGDVARELEHLGARRCVRLGGSP
jgi:Protein of unknown function (DUF3341)